MPKAFEIRLFRSEDAPALAEVIRRALYETNAKDYPAGVLEDMTALYQPEHIRALAWEGRMYVAVSGGEPVGCGALTPRGDKREVGYLQAVFLRPDCQGQGMGRAILTALETDPLGRSYGRIEVHASITAREFYERLGYRHERGGPELEDGHYSMYK